MLVCPLAPLRGNFQVFCYSFAVSWQEEEKLILKRYEQKASSLIKPNPLIIIQSHYSNSHQEDLCKNLYLWVGKNMHKGKTSFGS